MINRKKLISPQDIGQPVLIHNGKEWISISLKNEHIGRKAGSLVKTRKYNNKRWVKK